MRREILDHKWYIYGCCPGHDLYPNHTYRNRRSKKAHQRDKKAEHQHVRSIAKNKLRRELELEGNYMSLAA